MISLRLTSPVTPLTNKARRFLSGASRGQILSQVNQINALNSLFLYSILHSSQFLNYQQNAKTGPKIGSFVSSEKRLTIPWIHFKANIGSTHNFQFIENRLQSWFHGNKKDANDTCEKETCIFICIKFCIFNFRCSIP